MNEPSERPNAARPDTTLGPTALASTAATDRADAEGRLKGLTAAAISGSERPGDTIGPYKLLQRLGEGGFGIVWLAERREPIVQRVALKIIKPGMDTRAVIARFEQERQALAVMDHPHVAKVFDAGATASGRPYFVMEHVAGEPITAYCDRHNLPIRQRLELLIPVCEAVQHAHHKGLIHRDIKPSNILVAVRDGQPAPKVIDFGVAKAISHTLTDKTIFTETGHLIGTPEYMSPEQAEMGATDVDTRTDVYSLGVVLYEMLSGLLPFPSAILRAAGYEGMCRILREHEPDRPSTRLSQALRRASEPLAEASGPAAGSAPTPDHPSTADRRQTTLPTLVRELRRELEWIPLKAIRKDRTQRYATPADLARDIRNYLDGRPLEAGPESAVYRLRKFVRRNRGAVAGTAAVLVALLVGGVGFAWQAHRIGIERDATAAERDRAVAAEKTASDERDRAESITDFVVKSLQSQDPNRQGKPDMTVAEAMTQALESLDRGDLNDQPATTAALLRTISESLNSNGRSADAKAPAERALKIERELHTGDHPDVADSLSNLASVRERLGRAAEAESLYVDALGMYQRLFKGDQSEVATSLINLAVVRTSLGRAAEAEPLCVQALEMYQRLYKGDHPRVAMSLNSLAGVRDRLGRAAEAEPLFVQTLEMYQRLYKGDHPDVAQSLNNLAGVRKSLGGAAEAEPLYVQALEMRQRVFKSDHPDVAQSLNNLGIVRKALGRAAEAETLHVEALEMYRRLYKGDHPDVVRGLNSLASLRLSLGRAAEAELLYEQAMEMYQRLVKGDHPYVAGLMSNLALCLAALDRLPEARARAQDAAEMAARVLPEGDPVREYCDAALAEIGTKLTTVGASATTKPAPPPP